MCEMFTQVFREALVNGAETPSEATHEGLSGGQDVTWCSPHCMVKIMQTCSIPHAADGTGTNADRTEFTFHPFGEILLHLSTHRIYSCHRIHKVTNNSRLPAVALGGRDLGNEFHIWRMSSTATCKNRSFGIGTASFFRLEISASEEKH
jgi:hypothetical protein